MIARLTRIKPFVGTSSSRPISVIRHASGAIAPRVSARLAKSYGDRHMTEG
jgi:hypothetical protein